MLTADLWSLVSNPVVSSSRHRRPYCAARQNYAETVHQWQCYTLTPSPELPKNRNIANR